MILVRIIVGTVFLSEGMRALKHPSRMCSSMGACLRASYDSLVI